MFSRFMTILYEIKSLLINHILTFIPQELRGSSYNKREICIVFSLVLQEKR